MTTTDTFTTTPALPVIRYRNLSGAAVLVHDLGTPRNERMPENHHSATCAGCLDSRGENRPHSTLGDARTWAAKHSRECAALPTVTPESERQHEAFAQLAADYAGRAAGLLKSETNPLEGGRRSESEKQDPIGAALAYLGIADVYARLSGR